MNLRWLNYGAATLLALLLLAAVAGPWFWTVDPTATSLVRRLRPPVGFGGSWAHPLGTDQLGRDVLSRVLHGARVSLTISGAAIVLAVTVGTAIGLVAGFFRGGWFDQLVMFLVDVQLSLPFILLAIAIALAFGSSAPVLLLLAVLAVWSPVARMTRAVTIGVRHREFITASEAIGASRLRLLGRHVLPQLTNPVLVLAVVGFGNIVLFESSLSFLGIGIQPPTPTWGNMISEGREYLSSAWWLSCAPAVFLMLFTLQIGILGDSLRDRLDVHAR